MHESQAITIYINTKLDYSFAILFTLSNYKSRSVLSFTLMATQSFYYCSIFSTYGLVLTNYLDVQASQVGYYILPFAAANFAGAFTFSRFFDSVGRPQLIFMTYLLASVILFVTSFAFCMTDAI